MAKYYFTYGSEGHPFVGGWTEVEALDANTATAAFRVFHPDKIPGLLNCCYMYDEELFKRTTMFSDGNFGHRCRELIQLTRTEVSL